MASFGEVMGWHRALQERAPRAAKAILNKAIDWYCEGRLGEHDDFGSSDRWYALHSWVNEQGGINAVDDQEKKLVDLEVSLIASGFDFEKGARLFAPAE